LPVTALGQSAGSPGNAPAAETVGDLAEVTVTGTRIQRNGYEQPTPVTVMTTEELLATTPTNIADGLNRLPQFLGSRTRTFCCEAVSVGNYLNLRALGTNRTQVLLDSRRVVPTRESGDVDVNLLPEILIQRVDVVTGGASAAYGSDAVTGVVNYVIDNRFEGLKSAVQYGISEFGDDSTRKLALAGGTAFAGNRAHVVASVEYFKTDGITSLDDRPLSRRGAFMGGNGSAAAPYTVYSGVRQNTATVGGVIVNASFLPRSTSADPLAGLQFGTNGATSPFTFGTAIPGSPNFTVGGDGHLNNLADPAQALETQHAYVNLGYDFSDSLTATLRVNAGRSRNHGDVLASAAQTTATMRIFRDNAYLPASVGTAMDAASVTSFRFARFNRDFGPIWLDYRNQTIDTNFGLNGKFGNGWSWDASVSYGRTTLDARVENVLILGNYYAAVDAVRDPATGNTVCRVTLTNPGVFPGCVPLNLFGEGTPSAAAKDYVLDTSKQSVRNTQTVASAEVQGDLFSLPAGAVSVAFGGEYRRRALVEESNPVALSQIQATGVRGVPTAFCPTPTTCRFGGFNQGNFGVADASDNVAEAFVETVVPLLKDAPLAKALDLNAAYRYTDYKFSGGVSTYKFGVSYQPVEDLRIRAAISRDIRAPNLFELFAGPVNAFQAGLSDPFTGITNIIGITRTQGNPDLKPEQGDTRTFGLVYSPSWLPGFSGSIDYYNIDISGALAATTAQATLDQCFSGDSEACSRISRDAAGAIQQIRLVQINLDRRRASGIDVDLSYTRQVGPGTLRVRTLFNHAMDYRDTVGGVTVQRVGTFASLVAIPKWRGNVNVAYGVGKFETALQERIIGKYEQFPPAPGQLFAEPTVPTVYYTDLTLTYRPSDRLEVYGTANNVFGKQPPYVPVRFAAGLAFPSAAISMYDLDNRYFSAGLRYRF
jgi:outer membrane receptor protein involved in Fe transport